MSCIFLLKKKKEIFKLVNQRNFVQQILNKQSRFHSNVQFKYQSKKELCKQNAEYDIVPLTVQLHNFDIFLIKVSYYLDRSNTIDYNI